MTGKGVIVCGDFAFKIEAQKDGTSKCYRTSCDDTCSGWEELSDWAQLPDTVRRVFTQVENLK